MGSVCCKAKRDNINELKTGEVKDKLPMDSMSDADLEQQFQEMIGKVDIPNQSVKVSC